MRTCLGICTMLFLGAFAAVGYALWGGWFVVWMVVLAGVFTMVGTFLKGIGGGKR